MKLFCELLCMTVWCVAVWWVADRLLADMLDTLKTSSKYILFVRGVIACVMAFIWLEGFRTIMHW